MYEIFAVNFSCFLEWQLNSEILWGSHAYLFNALYIAKVSIKNIDYDHLFLNLKHS